MFYLSGMAGRPTDYKEEYVQQAFRLALLGATDKEMAGIWDVEESTVNNWKIAHPEFLVSIKAGKIEADAKVAESLYKIATGYQFKETTFEKIGPGDDTMEVGEEGIESIEQDLYKKKVVVKDQPPNVAAINIWLKNRRGKVEPDAQRWADKTETDISIRKIGKDLADENYKD